MKIIPIVFAILAAVFYSISIPLSKILLTEIPSTILAGFLYLGAGIGMTILYSIKECIKKEPKEMYLDKKDFKYVIGMIVLDILAPIFLLLSLNHCTSGTVSLLNNFEIVFTSLIALFLFKEKITKKLWIGILFITIASIVLSFDFSDGIHLNWYVFFALAACLCWGLENNCTRSISNKSPYQIVILKGLFSGLGAVIIGLIIGNRINNWLFMLYAFILGFISYGLSVFFYVLAQRYLGSAKTSSYYALAPFFGVILAFILFQEQIHFTFYIALAIMIIGIFFVALDYLKIKKKVNEIK